MTLVQNGLAPDLNFWTGETGQTLVDCDFHVPYWNDQTSARVVVLSEDNPDHLNPSHLFYRHIRCDGTFAVAEPRGYDDDQTHFLQQYSKVLY